MIIGEIKEVGRIGNEELSVDWRFQKRAMLLGEFGDNSNVANALLRPRSVFYSPFFITGIDKWCFTLYPYWTDETQNPAHLSPAQRWMRLVLSRRDVPSTRETFRVCAGIRGSEGVVEMERDGETEFYGFDSYGANYYYEWDDFCSISYLEEHRDRLLVDGFVTITCVIKIHASGEVPPAGVLVTYPYRDLEKATEYFCNLPDGGYKIGAGGFGTVYRAVIRGDVVAVKKLKDPVDKQFVTELKTLTNYKHENLLPLLGFSLGPSCCLLYEYMPNGSLEDRLVCVDRSKPLTWQSRLSIAYGSALGINHLHTFGEKPMVHRDIKSANILLGKNFVPKVGDFGLVRTGSTGGSSTAVLTGNVCGTSVYMPREAHLGDVSVKLDTFSFGVVLLELLTGLPPYDRYREDRDLITHTENCEEIVSKLDPDAGWDQKAATELYGIARRCVQQSKRSRPTISEKILLTLSARPRILWINASS